MTCSLGIATFLRRHDEDRRDRLVKTAMRSEATRGRHAVRSLSCLGIFRERAHSPGREFDDAEILEAAGFEVALRAPDASCL